MNEQTKQALLNAFLRWAVVAECEAKNDGKIEKFDRVLAVFTYPFEADDFIEKCKSFSRGRFARLKHRATRRPWRGNVAATVASPLTVKKKECKFMCTITKNNDFNSYELHFDGKPAESVRALLKANGYRWHKMRGIWYGYKDISALLNGATAEQSATAETSGKVQKPAKPESRLTYTAHGIKGKNGEKIGGCGDMVDYLPAYYDFDPVKLEIRLTVKDYKILKIIPNGCNCVDNSDYMTDYYENEHLTIPATAGAEFLAAAIGYQKHLETIAKKGAKMDYYRREYEAEQRKADALELAEQIASGTLDNGAEIIAERIQAEQNRQEQRQRDENKAFAAELLKEGNRDGQTVEQHGDMVIYRKATRMQIFDGSPLGFGRVETLETVICINIRTGEREQVQHVSLAEAYEFYKRVAA